MGHTRTARWLLAGATTVALVATPLTAATPALAAPVHAEVGLYGSTDPTYDGVYRQSLAILGLHAAGRTPAPEAIAWLRAQQCADGGFPSYRTDPGAPCPAFDPATYTGGEDTNATAVATQALLVTGQRARAMRAARWLRALQNPDGGWEYAARAGGGSDPNSTGLVLTALRAAKVTPKLPYVGYFASLQAGRADFAGTDPRDRGGIASPYSGGAPDVAATVQALPALNRARLTTLPTGMWRRAAAPAPSRLPAATRAGVSGWAASWLANQVAAGKVLGGNASWAVLSLAWDRTGKRTARHLYAQQIAGKVSVTDPGASGQAALAAAALGKRRAVQSFARRIAATLQRDTTAPDVKVATPEHPRAASSWKRLRVVATDAGSGVATVRVAVSEKRATGWYAYDGRAWKPSAKGAPPTWLRATRVTATRWSVTATGLTRGRLVVRAVATDFAGNRSAVRATRQKLSR